MTAQFKVGDLVRVPGKRSTGHWHSIKQGTVAEVIGFPDAAGDGCVDVKGFSPACGFAISQYVPANCLKLAKQAMRKREQYASRRG